MVWLLYNISPSAHVWHIINKIPPSARISHINFQHLDQCPYVSHYPRPTRPVTIFFKLHFTISPCSRMCYITAQYLQSAHIYNISPSVRIWNITLQHSHIIVTLPYNFPHSAHICHITIQHLAQFPYLSHYPTTSRPVPMSVTLAYNM
jgi:hypothetical protein